MALIFLERTGKCPFSSTSYNNAIFTVSVPYFCPHSQDVSRASWLFISFLLLKKYLWVWWRWQTISHGLIVGTITLCPILVPYALDEYLLRMALSAAGYFYSLRISVYRTSSFSLRVNHQMKTSFVCFSFSNFLFIWSSTNYYMLTPIYTYMCVYLSFSFPTFECLVTRFTIQENYFSSSLQSISRLPVTSSSNVTMCKTCRQTRKQTSQ